MTQLVVCYLVDWDKTFLVKLKIDKTLCKEVSKIKLYILYVSLIVHIYNNKSFYSGFYSDWYMFMQIALIKSVGKFLW